MNAVIVHGAYGHPGENWFPWLKCELVKLGYDVIAPRFPTPYGQELAKWLDVLAGAVANFDGQTIMIGHSIGCALILRKLERLRKPIKAAFLVSGFPGTLGKPEFDAINASFFEEPFEWKRIRRNCPAFFVYHGDDDPYVPVEKSLELSYLLDAELRVVMGGGHLNEAAGFVRFDALLDDIKTVKACREIFEGKVKKILFGGKMVQVAGNHSVREIENVIPDLKIGDRVLCNQDKTMRKMKI